MVRLATHPERSLTIFDAASSEGTLKTMLLMAASCMATVIAYSGVVHWTLRGKVKLDEHSH